MKKHLALVLAVCAALGMAGCGNSEQTEVVSELLEPVGVQFDVATVKIDDMFRLTPYDAEVLPYVEQIQFQADGYLEKMYVRTGDYVEAGQVLAVLDEETLLESIADKEDEIADIIKLGEFSDRQSEADIAIKKLELEELKELGYGEQTIRTKELDIRKLELDLEQTRELRQLELDEKYRELKVLEDKSGKNKISAPFSGRVIYVKEITGGDYVQGFQTIICMADDTRLSLVSDYVPQMELTKAERIYGNILGKEYELTYAPYAEEVYLEMILSGNNKTTAFVADAPEGELKSGMKAQIFLVTSYKENVLTVPANAVYTDQGSKYVYKMVDGQRVRCDVTIGFYNDVKVEILEGLQEGDTVYVKG